MLTACLYNQIEACLSPIDNLNALLAEERIVLPGGLQFSEGAQVKIYPSCCSGLENWREWLSVPNGNVFVWAGHDPTPQVELLATALGFGRMKKPMELHSLIWELTKLRFLLEKVEADLTGFVIRLGKWADFVAPSLRQRIVECFAGNMNIW